MEYLISRKLGDVRSIFPPKHEAGGLGIVAVGFGRRRPQHNGDTGGPDFYNRRFLD